MSEEPVKCDTCGLPMKEIGVVRLFSKTHNVRKKIVERVCLYQCPKDKDVKIK